MAADREFPQCSPIAGNEALTVRRLSATLVNARCLSVTLVKCPKSHERFDQSVLPTVKEVRLTIRRHHSIVAHGIRAHSDSRPLSGDHLCSGRRWILRAASSRVRSTKRKWRWRRIKSRAAGGRGERATVRSREKWCKINRSPLTERSICKWLYNDTFFTQYF